MEIRVLGSILCLMAAVPFTAFADEPQPPSPSKPDGVIGGYEYVDLGLPSGTLWATYNVGATSIRKGTVLCMGRSGASRGFLVGKLQVLHRLSYRPGNR